MRNAFEVEGVRFLSPLRGGEAPLFSLGDRLPLLLSDRFISVKPEGVAVVAQPSPALRGGRNQTDCHSERSQPTGCPQFAATRRRNGFAEFKGLTRRVAAERAQRAKNLHFLYDSKCRFFPRARRPKRGPLRGVRMTCFKMFAKKTRIYALAMHRSFFNAALSSGS